MPLDNSFVFFAFDICIMDSLEAKTRVKKESDIVWHSLEFLCVCVCVACARLILNVKECFIDNDCYHNFFFFIYIVQFIRLVTVSCFSVGYVDIRFLIILSVILTNCWTPQLVLTWYYQLLMISIAHREREREWKYIAWHSTHHWWLATCTERKKKYRNYVWK